MYASDIQDKNFAFIMKDDNEMIFFTKKDEQSVTKHNSQCGLIQPH